MQKYLLGEKVGMTQLMNDDGVVTPVTVLKVGPCTIVDIIGKEKRGYNALLLGYKEAREEKLTKPLLGQYKKYGVSAHKVLMECRVDEVEGYEPKQKLTLEIFEKNEKVNVRSKTIGRGFSGTIKRHNFRRGPMSHGSKSHRIPGSIGGGTYPGRVIKGKKMAGQHGNKYVTVKNLEIVDIDMDNGYIFLKGAIPGKKNNLVEIFR